jgi:hypothetical protein
VNAEKSNSFSGGDSLLKNHPSLEIKIAHRLASASIFAAIFSPD